MTDLSTSTLLDGDSSEVGLAGELLVFVEHVFTPDAERAARLAARAVAQGTRCRLVSVDSSAALAAFVAELGLDLPVGSDPHGTIAGAVDRWNPERAAARPGWVQVGRDGHVTASGDDDLPRAITVFLSAVPHAAPPPPERAAAIGRSGWLYLALSAALVMVSIVVFVRSGGGTNTMGEAPSTPPPAAVASAGGVSAPPRRTGGVKGVVGGGWYAVPPGLAGSLVRWTDGVLEVEGAESLEKPPMACQSDTVPLTTPVRVTGTWSLDGVGTATSKGARVGVRLLDERGVILPTGQVPGGSQIFVANGRLVLDWTAFSQVISPFAGATQVRVCVDNLGGRGVVRVRDVAVVPEG